MGGRGEWGQILKALRRSVMKSYLDSERLRRWCPWCRVFVSPLEKKTKKAQQAFFLIMSLGGPGVQYSQAFLSLVLIPPLLLLPAVSPSVRQVFPL